jgi:8-oxo-dGTP pyrophosphatase MutT (NUDIX family)
VTGPDRLGSDPRARIPPPDVDAHPGADGHLGAVRALVGTHLLVLPGVAAAVLDEARRLLLLLHADSRRWVLPGGAVEPDEHPADAAVRETREETGIEVRPDTVIAVDGGPGHHRRYRNGDEVSYVTTVFRCTQVGGRLRGGDHEALDLRWVPLDEVTDLPDLAPWVRGLLPHLDGDRAVFEPAADTGHSPGRATGRPAG